MSTDTFNELEIELIKKFNREIYLYYKLVGDEFKEYVNNSNNKDLLKCLKRKYSYLKKYKISKRTKITDCKASYKELFGDSYFKERFSDSDFKVLLKYCISKIRGLYKHAQALKTGFCNGQIITGFSEKNTISVCITKNTLEANEQWLTRLFKELNNRYPTCKLTDKIMIISSKKNNLNGHATHCKNIDSAWSYLKKSNKFKIVFICSNKIRIQDILELAVSFLDLREELVKQLRILHDEAHNTKEGIPPFRSIIENILMQPNVISYQPITASLGKIADSDNPMWFKDNLERHAINFTDFDDTKSDDPKYSSIIDAIKITFEQLKLNPNWVNHNIIEVSRINFMKVDDIYINKSLDDLTPDEVEDIDKRRKLEFCQFMKNNREKEALNNGLNLLNLNKILDFEYHLSKTFNLHIISTPCRKVLTHELCINAIKKEYDPVVLGIYGSQGNKYHLFVNGEKDRCVDDIMGDGEFNTKLFELIKYLKSHGYNTNRPFIIIGNYTPTGESLSYVNYNYGTVRGVTKLMSTNAEEDYQAACRGNYMNTKFLEHDSQWIAPEKYLIGHNSFICNALSYEAENDARIDSFAESLSNINPSNIILPSSNTQSFNSRSGTTAIPIKIKLNTSNPCIVELIEIASKERRTPKDKLQFMTKLKHCCETDEIECDFIDKSGKFVWSKMVLKDFRCYKKEVDSSPKIGHWKFKNYKNNFITGQPFINNTGNHKAFQCEILVCKDLYIIKKDNGDVLEKNYISEWWIGYKY